MKLKSTTLLLSFVFLFLASCDKNTAITESKNLESGIWGINELVEFNVGITRIDKSYNLFIEMDIYEDFLTNNLWVFIHTQSPSGNIQSDTLMFYVADEKGEWFGNKNGETINNKFLYKSNIQFVESGIYQFSLFHGMREHDLPKVSEVGIRIEEITQVIDN